MIPRTTELLSQFVVDSRYSSIPKEAIERARIMFLDTIGVALAAAALDRGCAILRDYVREIGGSPEATILGSDVRSSSTNAALANAHLAHALDFDDWEEAGHPSCMIVATSLALGEKLNLSGKAILEAYILGIEVYDKIAYASPNSRMRGWHGTAIYGALGSAAAAAKLLGLDVQQTVMALGIAACEASGIFWRPHGTMSKPFQVGNAARNGVESALLAKRGFTSDYGIIENPDGFCDSFLGKGNCNYSQMTRNLGAPFHIVSPGLGIKPYPCRYPAFRSIEATLGVMKENNLAYEDIDYLEVNLSPYYFERQHMEPRTGLEAKFSHRYICAMAMIDEEITLETFTDRKVSDAKSQAALKKVRLISNEAIPEEARPDTWSIVSAKLKDGRTFNKRVDVPRGDIRKPLAVDEVVRKFRNNAKFLIPSNSMDRSVETLLRLDELQNVRDLMRAFAVNQ